MHPKGMKSKPLRLVNFCIMQGINDAEKWAGCQLKGRVT